MKQRQKEREKERRKREGERERNYQIGKIKRQKGCNKDPKMAGRQKNRKK